AAAPVHVHDLDVLAGRHAEPRPGSGGDAELPVDLERLGASRMAHGALRRDREIRKPDGPAACRREPGPARAPPGPGTPRAGPGTRCRALPGTRRGAHWRAPG